MTDQPRPAARDPRVVVVPLASSAEDETAPDRPDEADATVQDEDEDVRGMVAQPAKVMRIGTMVKQLLDEVRSAPLDDAARARLAEVHERSLHELEEGLSPELIEELHRITLPFSQEETPSDAELRIAQAQLVGWLEGLFHGIQTALVAQQMATQAQLQQMRRALPPGMVPAPGARAGDPRTDEHGTGQYL
ncbi:bacterial proteasome activator family protein [Cellulomonas palmilytica]|uniref:bacterial proteasome activator family protein n=1 Tax=Cellulomonas palmilytica TaxID=2608402 RepID=UPI001F160150|nr:bacterial proteasome activator family protein [Cellulomonas palmilytica]UJP40777.1 bacterial proteasome activator family protein [Cellulomonas palmilytica]